MNGKLSAAAMIKLNIRYARDNSLHSMQVDIQMSVADLAQNVQQYLSIPHDHDRKNETPSNRLIDQHCPLFFQHQNTDSSLLMLNKHRVAIGSNQPAHSVIII
jgi:hypothetical protein